MYLKAYFANGRTEIFDATTSGMYLYIRMYKPLMIIERFDKKVVWTKEEGIICTY